MAIAIFSCNAGLYLAKEISRILQIPLGRVLISRYPNDEIHLEILDKVHDTETFIVQSLCNPLHENLFELTLLANSLKVHGAKHITAIVL